MSSAGGFKASENRAVAGELPAGFSSKRSSALGTLLVVAFGGLVASGGGPSVSSGTRLASGSSSAAVFSSASADGSTVAGVGGVPASAVIIIGSEKLRHTPRKSASGRTACRSLSDLIETSGQSVSCGHCVMFCGARLSMDCARVKELQGGDVPPLVVRSPSTPTLAQNCQQQDCRYEKALTV